ncbi:MAG TPA: MFS transporter [Candidatus Paceibacterota bacterium]
MNRKNVFLWTLYDFANSIVTIVFFLYFSQWLVVDRGVSDFWYNMIFAVGSLLLLLTAPVLGSIADKTGRQQKYFNKITVLVFIFYVGASLVTLFLSHKTYLAVLFFLLANYLYQFSFVFYNAFLHRIAPPEKWGSVSGLGQAGNWFGQIVGLVITLPLASGAVYLIGEAGRAQTFLPAAILFFVLALPMLLLFKLPKREQAVHSISLKQEYREQWGKFRDLVKVPNMGLFLLAYFLFNDAIITAATNFPIYLQNVFAVTDKTKSLLLMGILATSVVGALITGWVSDRLGLRKTLFMVLGSWIVILPVLGYVTNFRIFVLFTVIMGFLYGAVWTVTRATMTTLCPPEKMNFGFSFYTLAERASTLVGPLTWGILTVVFANMGATRYRIAITCMTVFVIAGIVILRKVSIPHVAKVRL